MYCILTQDPEEWHSHRWGKALEKAGIPFIWVDIKDIVISHGRKPYVKCSTHTLDECEKIFVRGLSLETIDQVVYRVDVLRRLENLGVECINSPSAIEKCLNKSYATSLFEDAGLRVPRTVCCENYDDAYSAFLEMKDVVVKALCGSSGMNMVRVNDEDMAYRLLHSLEFHKFVFYVQEFLEHKNEDFRLLTCRDEVLCTAKRKGLSWITNVHQGGTCERIDPPKEMVEMALTASRLMGCHYCGIDILESGGELYIIEANAIPTMDGHQLVEDFDVVSKVVELLI